MKILSLFVAVLVLSAAAPVGADITMQMSNNGAAQTISANAQNIRIQGPDALMIFRGDQNVLWIVDQEKKTYSEMTQADVKAMSEQIKQASTQLQEQLKNVPPERRAALEALMAKHQGFQAPPTPVVKATGVSKTVNGWPCKEYTATAGQKVTDVWTTDPKNLNLTTADFSAFKGFSAFMTQMLPGMDTMRGFAKNFDEPAEGQVPGVPVLAVTHDAKGNETDRTELKSIDKSALPASTFVLPEGLKKEEMPTRPAAPPGP
jgi:hypothetical protein